MIRRQFIQLATLTGAVGLTSFGAIESLRQDPALASAKDLQTVTWHVRGFTCVTCAVGLETLLRKEKGVVSASATYPQSMVTIQYHTGLVGQGALCSMIGELGFTVDSERS